MPLSYEGKLILAPMVRVGTLPFRLLALEYGADLVYGPETVDKKLIGCVRSFNPSLGTFDYVQDGRFLVFRTHPSEKDRLIFQLGTAEPALALQAALLVADDVVGIDVNCGCPKRFSLQAGMGAALLKEPERLETILRTLVLGLPAGFPVTAKIRLLPRLEDTLDLARRLAATGIRALTVHARTADERPRHPAHWDVFPQIAQAIAPVPLIANGDILTQAHVEAARRVAGVSSLMIARGAQANVSIFRASAEGPCLPLMQVSQAYLGKATETGTPVSNAKYTLLQMWMAAQESGGEVGARERVRAVQRAKTYPELGQIFGLDCSGAAAASVRGGGLGMAGPA